MQIKATTQLNLNSNALLPGSDADICPVGHYCPVGTSSPEPCPKGTYNNGTGLQADSDCTSCHAGEYCQDVGMTATSGLCTEGYVLICYLQYNEYTLFPNILCICYNKSFACSIPFAGIIAY